MLLLTLRGTPTIYMGEELGMIDTDIPAGMVRDPAEQREPGKGLGRDPERTPFPWTDGPGRGFTTGVPWLPFGGDLALSHQRNDVASMAQLYRSLIALRRESPALSGGEIEDVRADGSILGYIRRKDGDSFRIVLNLGGQALRCSGRGTVTVGTHVDRHGADLHGDWELRPNEGVVLRLDRA